MENKPTIKKIEFEKRDVDPWLDEMKEEQRKKLSEFVGKAIVIKKGFCYESKTYGDGVTMLFECDGKEYYSTEFGNAIVRQFNEIILDVLRGNSYANVKVIERTSKKFGTKYIAFDTVD